MMTREELIGRSFYHKTQTAKKYYTIIENENKDNSYSKYMEEKYFKLEKQYKKLQEEITEIKSILEVINE